MQPNAQQQPLRAESSTQNSAREEIVAQLEEHKNDLAEGLQLRGARLIRADLSGLDLSRVDLSGADLSQANLVGTTLFGANLAGTQFFEADLSRAELTGANLTRAELEGANLSGAGMGHANLSEAKFTRADLSQATLTEANLAQADMRLANLEGARLRSADLSDADFSHACLRGASLDETRVEGASFLEVDLRASTLTGLRGFERAKWLAVDVRDIDFTGAYLLRNFILDQNYIEEFRCRSKWSRIVHTLWYLTSDCGRSLTRWAVCISLLALVFAWLYTLVGIDYGDHPTALSPLYFSVVTLTTLGYGDILPSTAAGQVVVMLEVVLGYVMLGGLLSIYSGKMSSRAHD